MFEKLKSAVDGMVNPHPDIDTSVFDDPLADTIDWRSMNQGAKSFKTHNLHRLGKDRAAFRLSLGGWIFYSIILLAGLAAMIVAPIAMYHDAGHLSIVMTIPVGLGLCIAWWGANLLRREMAPILFDRETGEYTHGHGGTTTTPLAQAHALQLLGERVQTEKGSYMCYEINLVLHDGSRVPVVQHGHLKHMRRDAERLADFLAVPLWDVANSA